MTVTAAITTLLLPLGVWLVIASAPPRQSAQRFGSSAVLAWVVATVAFAAFGFAFLFGNAARALPALPDFVGLRSSLHLALPTTQPWSLLGLHGFFFQGVPLAGLSLFLPYLALAQTCAVLVNHAIAERSNALTQIALAAASGGVAFGMAGHWIFGMGWLAMLGQNLGFGHGTVDVGGMATVGLIAGAFAIAFAISQPQTNPREPAPAPIAPPAPVLWRTLSGIILILVGAVAGVASNPVLGPQANRVALGFAINLLAASSTAGLFALVYTRFTSAQHTANLASAAHAVLAALIAISSAGGLLPGWAAVLLGLAAGGLSTLGVFWIQARLPRHAGLADATSLLVATVFAPAILSFVAGGLLANGTLGAGWNGVGAGHYLGVAHLGISGLLPVHAGVSDAGQLTAQLCGVLAVTLAAGGFAFSLMRLLRPALNANDTAYDAPTEVIAVKGAHGTPAGVAVWAHAAQASIVEPNPTAISSLVPLPQLGPTMNVMEPTLETRLISAATEAPASLEALAGVADVQSVLPHISSSHTNSHTDATGDELPRPSRPPRATPFVVALAEQNPPEEGLLERMRKLRRSQQPAQPVRARKIAYPTRVAGRRLIRHMVEDTSPKP